MGDYLPPTTSQRETLAAIRALRMVASIDAGEYRVTFRADDMPCPDQREAVAYYTTDAADAVGTAKEMRAKATASADALLAKVFG